MADDEKAPERRNAALAVGIVLVSIAVTGLVPVVPPLVAWVCAVVGIPTMALAIKRIVERREKVSRYDDGASLSAAIAYKALTRFVTQVREITGEIDAGRSWVRLAIWRYRCKERFAELDEKVASHLLPHEMEQLRQAFFAAEAWQGAAKLEGLERDRTALRATVDLALAIAATRAVPSGAGMDNIQRSAIVDAIVEGYRQANGGGDPDIEWVNTQLRAYGHQWHVTKMRVSTPGLLIEGGGRNSFRRIEMIDSGPAVMRNTVDNNVDEFVSRRSVGPSARPNDPCPCGSGRKFKKCHGVTGT